MTRKRRGYAAPEYNLDEELQKLSRMRPKRVENKLVIVPSLSFLGRTQPEDVMEDRVSYRNPHEFLEFAFPSDAPANVYPLASDPVYGFTCGTHADVRYLDLEAMFRTASEVFYDELGFEEHGTRSSTRSAFLDLHRKLGGEKPIVARLTGDEDFAEITPRYLRTMIGMSERFLWSYAANFRKLVFPLLAVKPGEPEDLRGIARNLAGGRPRLLNALAQRSDEGMKALRAATSRPGYLATLYALREAAQADRDDAYGRMMDPAAMNRISLGSRLVDGVWMGSGGTEGRSCTDAGDDIVALIATGMLNADPEESILTLSSSGERLLDLLPNDCDQPDWCLDLFDQDGFIHSSESRAVDDWTEAFFGNLAASAMLTGLHGRG